GARARDRQRPRPAGRGAVDELFLVVMDEGRQGLFLLALCRTAEGKATPGVAVGASPLLPQGGHTTVGGSADLRAQGSAHVVYRRLGNRGRTLLAHQDGARLRQPESPLLHRSRQYDTA